MCATLPVALGRSPSLFGSIVRSARSPGKRTVAATGDHNLLLGRRNTVPQRSLSHVHTVATCRAEPGFGTLCCPMWAREQPRPGDVPSLGIHRDLTGLRMM